jgi:hypothetical protein
VRFISNQIPNETFPLAPSQVYECVHVIRTNYLPKFIKLQPTSDTGEIAQDLKQEIEKSRFRDVVQGLLQLSSTDLSTLRFAWMRFSFKRSRTSFHHEFAPHNGWNKLILVIPTKERKEKAIKIVERKILKLWEKLPNKNNYNEVNVKKVIDGLAKNFVDTGQYSNSILYNVLDVDEGYAFINHSADFVDTINGSSDEYKEILGLLYNVIFDYDKDTAWYAQTNKSNKNQLFMLHSL